jgi:hypothetical protein
MFHVADDSCHPWDAERSEIEAEIAEITPLRKPRAPGTCLAICRPAIPKIVSAFSACSALLLLLSILATPLVAHDLARSESRCTIQGSDARCELVVDLLEFPGVDQDGNGTISYAELDRAIADVFADVKAHFVLRSPAEPSTIVMTRHELIDEHTARLTLVYTFPSDVSRLDMTSTIDQLAKRADHEHYATTILAGVEEHAILNASRPTVTFEFRRWTRTSVWLTVAALVVVGGRVGWFAWRRRRP